MPNRIIQYPVPLMLKKILKDKSSGELIVAGKNFSKSLFFIEGKGDEDQDIRIDPVVGQKHLSYLVQVY